MTPLIVQKVEVLLPRIMCETRNYFAHQGSLAVVIHGPLHPDLRLGGSPPRPTRCPPLHRRALRESLSVTLNSVVFRSSGQDLTTITSPKCRSRCSAWWRTGR